MFYQQLANPAEFVTPAETLTDREREALRLWVEGRTAEEIARRLELSESQVYRLLQSLRTKLRADNDAELGAIALRESLVPPNVIGT